MAQETINIGSSANDGTGDALRNAFIKTNSNFSELYSAKENLSNKSVSTSLGTSNTLYPTQNAVKTYVDTQVATKIGGSGTDNYIPRFNGTNALENSIIFDNGTNIGIGTTSPSGKLDIVGTNGTVRIESGGDAIAFLKDGANYISAKGGTSSLLVFETGLNERMRIDSSGNVGIGTSSPAAKIDVLVAQEVNGYSLSGYPFLKYSAGDVLDYGAFGATWTALRFLTNGSERIRITSSGNVGIGTSSPTFKLQVIDGTLFVGESSGAGSNQMGRLSFGSTGIGGGYTNYGGQIASYSGSGIDVSDLRFYTGNGSVSTERMRITSSGNVGIGTTNPTSKLHVVGLPTSSAGLTSGAIWNDGGTLKIV